MLLKPILKTHEFVWVAFSGGVDSVTLLDFLIRSRHRYNNIGLAFFNHRTETSLRGLEFLDDVEDFYREKYCYKIPIKIGELSREYSNNLEMNWRNERYSFFNSLEGLVSTGHHLDDCVETYLFTTIRNGNPKTIPYRNKNVIRPLLLTEKHDIIQWALKNDLKWIEDESNNDVKFSRNRIRHNIIPEVLKISPGFKTIVKKIVEKEIKESVI